VPPRRGGWGRKEFIEEYKEDSGLHTEEILEKFNEWLFKLAFKDVFEDGDGK